MIDAAETPAWVMRMIVQVEDALREIQKLAADLNSDQIRLARACMTGQGQEERARQVNHGVD